MDHVLDDLHCGYCRAPIVDHSEAVLKICVHRLTTAKRDLAKKVLTALDTELNAWALKPNARAEIHAAVERVLAESGVKLISTQKGKGK